MKKVLVILSEDEKQTIWSTQILRQIKRLPNVDQLIVYGTKKQSELLVDNPNIDLFLNEDNSHGLSEVLFNENLSQIVNLSDSTPSFINEKSISSKIVHQNKSFFQKLFAGFAGKKSPLDVLFDKAKPLIDSNDGQGISFYVPDSQKVQAHDIPTSHSAGYIAICITKALMQKINIEQFRNFANQLQHPLMLVGDSDIRYEAERITFSDDVKIYNACGKFNFYETADLIQRSKIFIGEPNDYLWMAIAKQVKSIVLANPKEWSKIVSTLYDQNWLKQQKKQPFKVQQNFVENGNTEQLISDVNQLLSI